MWVSEKGMEDLRHGLKTYLRDKVVSHTPVPIMCGKGVVVVVCTFKDVYFYKRCKLVSGVVVVFDVQFKSYWNHEVSSNVWKAPG